jgi:hypothetical protein
MKNVRVVLIQLLVTGTFIACNNPLGGDPENPYQLFKENPVTITWEGEEGAEIQSFQANVQVYVMNNRKDTGATLRETYGMAIKTINEKTYVRLDYIENNGAYSLISNGEEAISFDPTDNQIPARILLEKPASPLLKLFGQETGLSRINLSLIREEVERLDLDILEDTEERLVFDLPEELFSPNPYEQVTRRRVSFDTNNETLLSTEIITILEDGTEVTTTASPVYEEVEGVPVKIGMVTVIDSKAVELIKGIDETLRVYDSPEEIPTLSREDFEKMSNEGILNEMSDIPFDNPADLSYTETTVELYQDIEINAVSDELFKLLLD